jgi:hypothetical protein
MPPLPANPPYCAVDANSPEYASDLVAKAYVDPADPTNILLTQPVVDDAQRLREPPRCWLLGRMTATPVAPAHCLRLPRPVSPGTQR